MRDGENRRNEDEEPTEEVTDEVTHGGNSLRCARGYSRPLRTAAQASGRASARNALHPVAW